MPKDYEDLQSKHNKYKSKELTETLRRIAESALFDNLDDRTALALECLEAVQKDLDPSVMLSPELTSDMMLLSACHQDLSRPIFQSLATELSAMKALRAPVSYSHSSGQERAVTLVTFEQHDPRSIFARLSHVLVPILRKHIDPSEIVQSIKHYSDAKLFRGNMDDVRVGTRGDPDYLPLPDLGLNDLFAHNRLNLNGEETDHYLYDVYGAQDEVYRTFSVRGVREWNQHYVQLEIPVQYLVRVKSVKYTYRFSIGVVRFSIVRQGDPLFLLKDKVYTSHLRAMNVSTLTLRAMALWFLRHSPNIFERDDAHVAGAFAALAYLYEGGSMDCLMDRLAILEQWLPASLQKCNLPPLLKEIDEALRSLEVKLVVATGDLVERGGTAPKHHLFPSSTAFPAVSLVYNFRRMVRTVVHHVLSSLAISRFASVTFVSPSVVDGVA